MLLFVLPQITYAISLKPVEVSNASIEIHIPKESIQIFEDKQRSLSFDQISDSSSDHKFHSISSLGFFNNERTAYWVRFKIINASSPYNKWLIQAPLHTDQVEAYIPLEDGSVKKLVAGQFVNFSDRQYSIRSIAFDLPSIYEKEYTIYLRITSRHYIDLSFLIANQAQYTHILAKTNYFLGIIYGILFLMALYNFILYFSIKEKIYIYYVLYTLSCALFISWKDGFGFEILWPELPYFNVFHHKLGLFLLVITFTLYGLDFLELKKNQPNLYKSTFVLIGANIIYFLAVLFNPEHFDPLPLPYFLTLSFFYSVVIYYLIKGYKPSRYIFFGSSFLIAALIIIKLRYMGLMDWNWFVEHVLNYAVVVEVISMSLAIRDKIIYLRTEKEKAQIEKEKAQEAIIYQLKETEKLKDKVNRELEQKVKERTLELHQKVEELNVAKEKLAKSYEELGKFSSKLDLDNWNLKKDIKEERQQRMSSALISYEKFIELYPDETSCLRFIYQRKWGEDGNQYECNRCGNKKCFDLSNLKFAKKCTRCNYIETVTANTLFHRVKFEMNKAFYIVYVVTKEVSLSTQQLSDQIDLRKNTCWKFRKRVEEKMEEFKAKKKVNNVHSWESLIVE
jgi:hypothetical protein